MFGFQIELKAEDLYDKEKVDLETIVIDDVFTLLQCNDQGLTDEEAKRRLELFGPNKLESEEQNAFLQVIKASHTLRPFKSFSRASFLVPLIHVESSLVGDGGRCFGRYRSVER